MSLRDGDSGIERSGRGPFRRRICAEIPRSLGPLATIYRERLRRESRGPEAVRRVTKCRDASSIGDCFEFSGLEKNMAQERRFSAHAP
jgi:hypothetical protein